MDIEADFNDTGIVYILTNEAMPGYIKVGYTTDIKKRMKDLNTTSVPLPFELFYAKKCADASNVEKRLKGGLSSDRINPKREFFTKDPEEIRLLLEMAPGEEVRLSDEDIDITANERKEIDKQKKRRSNFNFKMVGIPVGAELKYKENDRTVIVKDEKNMVELDDEDISLSDAALTLLNEGGRSWKAAQGAKYFTYEGKLLQNIRDELEE